MKNYKISYKITDKNMAKNLVTRGIFKDARKEEIRSKNVLPSYTRRLGSRRQFLSTIEASIKLALLV